MPVDPTGRYRVAATDPAAESETCRATRQELAADVGRWSVVFSLWAQLSIRWHQNRPCRPSRPLPGPTALPLQPSSRDALLSETPGRDWRSHRRAGHGTNWHHPWTSTPHPSTGPALQDRPNRLLRSQGPPATTLDIRPPPSPLTPAWSSETRDQVNKEGA
jgi:hypothetical protein